MTIARAREFCAARTAARYGMRLIGEKAAPILRGEAGEPCWPPMIVGSLSHTHTHAAAFIARAAEFAALGVDLDDGRAIGDAAAADLMTPREVQLITDLGLAKDAAIAQVLIFTGKEALFKCQFPLTKNAGLDFLDVELVRAAGEDGALTVALSNGAEGSLQLPTLPLISFLHIQGLTLAAARIRIQRYEKIV